MTRRNFPCRRSIFICMPLVMFMAGCTPYDRNAPAPLGGELPLDRDGGGIDVVSGTTGARDPRPITPVGIGTGQGTVIAGH